MSVDIDIDYKETTITCACGHKFTMKSAGADMHINTCSACHPFYTGQAKFIDTEGRVEKFKKRYAQK